MFVKVSEFSVAIRLGSAATSVKQENLCSCTASTGNLLVKLLLVICEVNIKNPSTVSMLSYFNAYVENLVWNSIAA